MQQLGLHMGGDVMLGVEALSELAGHGLQRHVIELAMTLSVLRDAQADVLHRHLGADQEGVGRGSKKLILIQLLKQRSRLKKIAANAAEGDLLKQKGDEVARQGLASLPTIVVNV